MRQTLLVAAIAMALGCSSSNGNPNTDSGLDQAGTIDLALVSDAPTVMDSMPDAAVTIDTQETIDGSADAFSGEAGSGEAGGGLAARLVVSPSTPQTFVGGVGNASIITFGVANAGDLPTGPLAIAITGSSTFSVASTTCSILAPLAGCTLAVAYKLVAVSATRETATLTILDTGPGASSVSIPLVGAGLGGPATLVITPATSDLGTVLLGLTGLATVFTVSNTGDTSSGVLTASLSSSDFVITDDTCTGTTLVVRTGSCTVSVALRPETAGAKTATLTVARANGVPAVKTITGTGRGGGSGFATMPAALDFGSVPIGTTSAAQTFTIKNNGGGSTGSPVVTKQGDSTMFLLSENTCASPLAPGATCAFKVSFAPTAEGSHAAAFTISDGSMSGVVAVSGTGTL